MKHIFLFSVIVLVISAGLVTAAEQDSAIKQDIWAGEVTEVIELRKSILDGQHGKKPIREVVDTLISTEGPELQDVYLALALRKQESLPAILDKLKTGGPAAKRKITKLIRYTGLAETSPALLEIILSDNEHELSRIGALYALGAIGDKSAGPVIALLLGRSGRGKTETRIMIATLARLNYQQAVPKIRQYSDDKDPLVRIFAIRALADLGEKPPIDFLLESFDSEDFVIREAACGALGSCGGAESITRLTELAQRDPIGSVREEAQVSLLRLQAAGMNELERSKLLEALIGQPEKKVRAWAICSLAVECGNPGKAVLRKAFTTEKKESRRIAFYLLVLPGAGPNFRGGY